MLQNRALRNLRLDEPLSRIKLARRRVQNGLQLRLGGFFQRHRFVLRQDPIEPTPVSGKGYGSK